MGRKLNLPEDVQRFIVECLACFDSPSTVVAKVAKEFGHTVTRQGVECYDPGKVQGAKVSAKLREHFYKVRETFRLDIDQIPIASKAVRLRRLDLLCEIAMEAGTSREAADLLEQAAKEVGGVFSGRSAIETGKSNEPLEPRHPGHDVIAEIAARYGLPADTETKH